MRGSLHGNVRGHSCRRLKSQLQASQVTVAGVSSHSCRRLKSQLQASQVTVAGVSCNRAASPKAHGGMRGRVTGEWQSCYVSFHECVRTSKIYVRDCTPVPPLAMLLFCKSNERLKPELNTTPVPPLAMQLFCESTHRRRPVPAAQNVWRHGWAFLWRQKACREER